MSKKEYKFIGLNMESISIIYGIFLIIWGLTVNYFSSSSSITSFIPTFLGLPVLFFATLALTYPTKKKLLMHIVVLFGILIAIGGFDVLRSAASGNLLVLFWADLSKLMMLLTGSFFTFLCIQSFRFARSLR